MSSVIPQAPGRNSGPDDLSHDVQLARAIANTVKGVRGVAEINPDPLTGCATFGAGETVYGINLTRHADTLEFEVRLIIEIDPLGLRYGLNQLADKVRAVIMKCLRKMGVKQSVTIHIAFDDIVERRNSGKE